MDKGLIPLGKDIQLETLRILVHKMKKDGIQVILVFPLLNSMLNLISRPIHKRAKTVQAYHDFAESNDIPILNYTQDLPSVISHNPSYFVDKVHLSAEGAYHFSQLLKKDISPILASYQASH